MKTSKKKKKILVILEILILSFIVILTLKNMNPQNLKKENMLTKSENRTMALYIEDDTGTFIPSPSNKFPKEGYILDLEKSICENGEKPVQNFENKSISLSVNQKTSCTLYFKKEEKPSNVDILINKANPANITDYNMGNKKEMYTFSHPSTSQTESLIDYRYIGNAPNNYINFNNETWRIIGVFTVEGENEVKEQRIKIIRNDSIGNLMWNTESINEWSTSSLSTLLNAGDYFNRKNTYSSNGLTNSSKNQIAPTKWYLGGNGSVSGPGGPDYYNFERGTDTYTGRKTNIIAKVGLMYPSDYVYTYANGVDNQCFTDGHGCSSGTPSTGWLYNSLIQWTITPHSSNQGNAYIVDKNGGLYNYFHGVINADSVRPNVYLRSDIEIISGSGTKSNPYILQS